MSASPVPLITTHLRNIHEAASAASLFNSSSCRLVLESCVTERRRESRRQSDLPRFTQHAPLSDTLCCPQIILSCRVFLTGLITCVAARSRKNEKRKASVLPQRHASVHYTLARRRDADLHRSRSLTPTITSARAR